MYNQPYFIPGYFAPGMMSRAMNQGTANVLGNALNGTRLASSGFSKGLGLFSRLGSSIKALKGVNWGNLITNTSKTLNVVNQAIPLVRQVGPMVNNVKSMLRVASVFKDETDKKPIKHSSNNVNSNNLNNNSYSNKDIGVNNNESYDYSDNSPTFFISS